MSILAFVAGLIWGAVIALPLSCLAMLFHVLVYRKGYPAAWVVFQKTFYWTFGVVAVLIFVSVLASPAGH